MDKSLEVCKKNRTVLLADDDSDDRDLFQEAIGLVDPLIKTVMVGDGEQLMDYLHTENEKPDMIFLDLNMPRKNGKECLREIRNEKNMEKIPVVIYTTSLNPTDIEDTYKDGATNFLRKPNSFEELKRTIHDVLLSNLENNNRNKEKFVLNSNLKTAYK